MSDPVKTPIETPNQPAVETPAPAATPVAPAPAVPTPSTPAANTPPASAPAAAAPPPAPVLTPPEPATPPAAITPPEIKYAIKAPEGMQIDPEFLPSITPVLKKHNVSNEVLQDVMTAVLESQKELPKRTLARDLEVTMKDPDVGGMNYGRTQAHVSAALAAFTHPEFRSLLGKTGMANNLEFVRVFERIGKAMQGDTPASGRPDGAPQLSRAEKMYGKTTPT